MRYRLMATYEGSPFEAGIGPTDADIVLFAACPPPEELGFEPATGHWRKQLHFADVQAVWESRPVGTFRGERCMVLDDLGDRLHIGYLGHDGFKAEQLGFWQVDRGVFELVAPRTEVTDILEERTEYTRPQAPPRQGTGPQPADSGQYTTSAAHSQADAPRSSGQYTTPAAFSQADAPRSSGQYTTPAGYGLPVSQADSGPLVRDQFGTDQRPAGYLAVPDSTTGVAMPVTADFPLPLEAEAMRAASAARRPSQPAPGGAPAGPPATPVPASLAVPPVAASQPVPAAANPGAVPAPAPAGKTAAHHDDASPATAPPASSRQRRATRPRKATERLFADLAMLAGIPAGSYAVGEDVDGALCLIQNEHGFEVFHSAGGGRHELQVFATEESACFYLFGVLAAEAVRNGSLARVPAGLGAGQPQAG